MSRKPDAARRDTGGLQRPGEISGRGALAGVRIVEGSWLAGIAARKLRGKRVAMVLGRSIHLSGVTEAQFLGNASWVAHELAHVRQFQRYGVVRFILLYLLESVLRGYHDNRFEVEARQAGLDKSDARVL